MTVATSALVARGEALYAPVSLAASVQRLALDDRASHVHERPVRNHER